MIAAFDFIPGAPITRDQWLMLQRDNVVSKGAKGLEAFGIAPAPLETKAPEWLVQYRRHGRFNVDNRSEEHTSELQSLMRISYAVFCLKKKTKPHLKQAHD